MCVLSPNAIKALQKNIAQFDKKENSFRHQNWVAEFIKDGKMAAAMKRAEPWVGVELLIRMFEGDKIDVITCLS